MNKISLHVIKQLFPENLVDVLNDGLPLNEKIQLEGRVVGVEMIKYQYPQERLEQPKGEAPTTDHHFLKYQGEFTLSHLSANCFHFGEPYQWDGSRTIIDVLRIEGEKYGFQFDFSVKKSVEVKKAVFLIRDEIYISIEALRESYLILRPTRIIY